MPALHQQSRAGKDQLPDVSGARPEIREASTGDPTGSESGPAGIGQDVDRRAPIVVSACADGTILLTYHTGVVEAYAPAGEAPSDGVLFRYDGRWWRRTAVVVAAGGAPAR